MKIKLLIAGFGFVFLNGTAALADLDPLQNYDNFNDKKYNGCKNCINPDKWRGLQRGDYTSEIVREIKSKRARLAHRSWGRSDSDAGREQGRNRMNFRDSVDFSGACFTPRVKKYEVNDCGANPESSRVRIRYLGNFFDTDAADSGEEDGIIYASISLQRNSDSSAKKGIFNVSAWVDECEGTDCDTSAWGAGVDFGNIKASKNKKEMCIGYDRAANGGHGEFVISFGNDVRTITAADGLPARDANVDANWTWHVVETRADVENCSAGAISGFIDAEFDNVKIREYQ